MNKLQLETLINYIHAAADLSGAMRDSKAPKKAIVYLAAEEIAQKKLLEERLITEEG